MSGMKLAHHWRHGRTDLLCDDVIGTYYSLTRGDCQSLALEYEWTGLRFLRNVGGKRSSKAILSYRYAA